MLRQRNILRSKDDQISRKDPVPAGDGSFLCDKPGERLPGLHEQAFAGLFHQKYSIFFYF